MIGKKLIILIIILTDVVPWAQLHAQNVSFTRIASPERFSQCPGHVGHVISQDNFSLNEQIHHCHKADRLLNVAKNEVLVHHECEKKSLISNTYYCNSQKPLHPLKFAGVWLRGSAAESQKNFPVGFNYAMGGGDESKASRYSAALLAKIRQKQKTNGSRIIDLIAPDEYLPSASTGQAFVMACAINYEISENGVLPSGVIGCFGEIGFDLMICDFSNRKIVYSIPCRLVFQEHAEKSGAHLVNLYENHLPGLFVKIAENEWRGDNSSSTLGIGKVTIVQPSNTAGLPADIVNIPEQFSDRSDALCAQLAASRIHDTTGMPIQPYSRGEEAVFYGLQENLCDASSAIAKKIREEHANGVGFILKQPDYIINLKGVYARQKNKGFVNYTTKFRIEIASNNGSTIYNEVFDACADPIPYRTGGNMDVWHYFADSTVRAVESASNNIIKAKKNNAILGQIFADSIKR